MNSKVARKIPFRRIVALAAIPLMVFALLAMGAPVSQAKEHLSPPAIPSEPPEPTEPPVLQCVPLSITIGPSGAGTVDRSPAKSEPCLLNGEYLEGEQVTLTANPDYGYGFLVWEGDASGTASSTAITIDADPEVGAYFTQCYSVNVIISPAGSGSVSKSAATCPNGLYRPGYAVYLTATANSGYAFKNWTGTFGSPNNPIAPYVYGNINMTANFWGAYRVHVPLVVK